MPTYSPAQARSEIENLVETFARNESALQHTPEAQIENDFLRPLFRYLNWNVDNVGLARAQWEFVLQRTERGKRPDYELWLAGRRVLIMDAKKVKYEMHDPRWQNQVYAYAYSTQNDAPSRKTDFAILTDFQEFIVLDCTLLAGAPEAINNFRVLDWRYPDYVARFDELWELFERDNVLQASRSVSSNAPTGLWARYLAPKKVKANRVPPDKAFLSALDDVKTGWRVRLAKDMKKHNPVLGGEILTAAVQLWIDRLIFIKVLSDREIEDDYLAQMADVVERDGLAENNFGWFTATRGIFQKLNQIYNGTIFAPRPELEAVNVSNKIVREIIGELLPENSPYNFASLPVEILGTIYERFLGRVVHATEKQVRIEDKPEVRKAGGVFYTPQYIVNYIVAQTVGKLLAECKTPADVAQLKILDPACGSGSFLIGAYDALIRWHEEYYQTADGGRQTAKEGTRSSSVRRPSSPDAFYLDDDGRVRLTAKLKRQILVANLFGVDIDPQAVEVTRLSLSLKALEDTRRAELYQEVDLFHQRVLPDLTQNIKCGNSLIGADFIFTDADELKRVNPFEWRAEFPQVFTSPPAPLLEGEGSRALSFPPSPRRRGAGGEVSGFDAVIGNPPYGADLSDLELGYVRERFKYQGYQFDSYMLFVEKSLGLTKESGLLGMIIPNTWLLNLHSREFRQFIFDNTQIENIVHFLYSVFYKVTVDTEITILKNTHPNQNHPIQISVLSKQSDQSAYSITQQRWQSRAGNPVNIFERPEIINLADRLRNFTNLDNLYLVTQGAKPFQVGKGKPPQTRKIVDEKPFIAEDKRNQTFRPLLRGSLIQRYKILWHYDYWISFGDWLAEPRYSANYDAKEKIVIRQTGDSLVATLDTRQFIVRDNLYTIVPRQEEIDLRLLLALLNSRLLNWFYQNIINPERGEALAQVKRGHIAQLPIRTIDFTKPADIARHDKMVALVERMLALHQHRASAQTESDQQLFQRQIDATDKLIDALVYELYELTAEEIRIVEL